MPDIIFIGAGAIATALGNVLARSRKTEIHMITVEGDVAESINRDHLNYKYFPSVPLENNLVASSDFSKLEQRAVVFIAIPSVVTVDFLIDKNIHPESLLVNLAKGFGSCSLTIIECLEKSLPNPVCSLKGPSFAREIINNQPTSFTVGSARYEDFEVLRSLFSKTNIYLDYSGDVAGVEYLSILKNIYAIAIGVVDAQYDSLNLKFMIFTRAMNEIKFILDCFGGKEDTLFRYCGFGDFGLTALNDLSRNRTLGLLIGKGFFTDNISDKVVLEGRIAVNVFMEKIRNLQADLNRLPIFREIYRVFNQNSYPVNNFVNNILADGITLPDK